MKHRYIFIRNLNGFGVDDVVYHVWIGDSSRELTKLELIRCYCKDTGFYFKLYDDNVSRSIWNLASSLFAGTSMPTLYLRTAHVSASQLFDLIVDDAFVSFEKSLTVSRAWSFVNMVLSPSSYFHNQLSRCNTSCPQSRRKYLSPEHGGEFLSVVKKVGLILALIGTSMYLESIERLFY